MNTLDTAADPDTEAIIQMLVTGKPLDPEVRERLCEDGLKLVEEVRRQVGQTNIAVDLIRESRDQ
jgi:hypothetical protein